jgi:hypothetical protein
VKIRTSSYEPRSEIPGGKYPFKVAEAKEGVSEENKNEMITLILAVDIPDWKEPIKCYDHLVNTPKALFKIEEFVKATGQSKKFTVKGSVAQGSLTAADCIGKRGIVELIRSRKGRYLEVREYLQPSSSAAPVKKKKRRRRRASR